MTAYLQPGSYQYSGLELGPLSWMTTHSVHSSVFTADSVIPLRSLRGIVFVTMLLLGRCWMS